MFLNRSFLIATGFSLTIFSFLSCSFECNELLVDGYDNIWVMLDQKNDGKLTDKQQFSNLLEQKIKLWREHTGTVFLHIPKIFEFLDVLEYYTFECYRTHDLTIEKVLKSQIDRRVQKALTLTFEEDVKKSLSNVPELTVKNGLKLHSLLKNEYAKILNNKVWAYTLNLGKEDKIPQIGTKTAGVGAVIFNKDGKKMLIVQEKANHLGGSRKYPTGSVKKNESLMAGLFREIQEEVSLAKKDLDVIGEAGYWETPGSGIYKDGCDIFHLYALKYKGEEKTIIYQKSELQDALWIDVDEFIKEKEKTYKPSAELIKVAKALNEGRLLKTSAKPVIIKGFEYMDLYIPEINNPDELFFEFGKYE